MSDVSLRGVRKSYGSLEVVHGVDLDIQSGEFVVFVGPSGCGKSTLLRMIAGLEPISGGEISIGGQVVNDVPSPQRGIAMVFQSYALYPHMSVYDNVGFGLKLASTPRDIRDRKIRDAARVLQMEHLLDRKPAQLSGGQRQRVAIGRAIVRQPDVFLFDEPLSNLDAALRVDMRMELARLHHDLDATMIYVTHDQVEAMMARGREALARIPGVRRVFTGRAVAQQSRYRCCWLVEFVHEKVIDSYRQHPEHVFFANQLFRPIAGDRISIDFIESGQAMQPRVASGAERVRA